MRWKACRFILVADLYAGRRSAALQGVLAGLMGISFIAGPLVGGLIADSVGWRWAFLVNLPIGAAALAVVAIVLPASIGRREGRAARLDLAGIALLTAVDRARAGRPHPPLRRSRLDGLADRRPDRRGPARPRRVHRASSGAPPRR